MRFSILMSFFILLSITTFAEGNEIPKTTKNNSKSEHFKGVVTDRYTGEALVGVKVQIKGTDAVTYTDFDGKYEFNGVKEEIVKLRFDFVTYKTVVTDLINLNSIKESYNQLLYPRR